MNRVEYIGVHSNAGVYRNIYECTQKYSGLRKYAWVYKAVHGFTGIHMGLNNNTGVYTSKYLCTFNPEVKRSILRFTYQYRVFKEYTWLYIAQVTAT